MTRQRNYSSACACKSDRSGKYDREHDDKKRCVCVDPCPSDPTEGFIVRGKDTYVSACEKPKSSAFPHSFYKEINESFSTEGSGYRRRLTGKRKCEGSYEKPVIKRDHNKVVDLHYTARVSGDACVRLELLEVNRREVCCNNTVEEHVLKTASATVAPGCEQDIDLRWVGTVCQDPDVIYVVKFTTASGSATLVSDMGVVSYHNCA